MYNNSARKSTQHKYYTYVKLWVWLLCTWANLDRFLLGATKVGVDVVLLLDPHHRHEVLCLMNGRIAQVAPTRGGYGVVLVWWWRGEHLRQLLWPDTSASAWRPHHHGPRELVTSFVRTRWCRHLNLEYQPLQPKLILYSKLLIICRQFIRFAYYPWRLQ